MTRPDSLDLRERMVRAVEASRRAPAAKFDVSPSCVVKLLQRWQRQGTLEPAPGGGGRRAKLADHAELVHVLLAAAPDSTIAELKTRLAAAGIAVSRAAISRFLKAGGLTRKKRTAHAAEQERPDVAAARRAWREQQPALSPERLVLIDETWATTALARGYGRARRGHRVVGAVPTATGRPRPSSPRCATTARPRPACSMARSTARASAPMSSRRWRRRCAPGTAW